MIGNIVAPYRLCRALGTDSCFWATIPKTYKVISLIGREQWLMDIFTDGGIPAVANVLDIPVDTLTHRWRKFKKHHWDTLHLREPSSFFKIEDDYEELFSDEYCTHTDPPFNVFYSGCEPVMSNPVTGKPQSTQGAQWSCTSAEARRELNKLLEEEIISKGIDLTYDDRVWILFAPRLDLGLVSLIHYAEQGDCELEAAKLIIKNLQAYRQPPLEELIKERPKYMDNDDFDSVFYGKDEYKRLRLFRGYRKSQCYKLAYPRYPSRVFRVLWDEPKTHEGETFYPIEALWTASVVVYESPHRIISHGVASPGSRGGYVTAEYVAENGCGTWILEGEYATTKKSTSER